MIEIRPITSRAEWLKWRTQALTASDIGRQACSSKSERFALTCRSRLSLNGSAFAPRMPTNLKRPWTLLALNCPQVPCGAFFSTKAGFFVP